MDYGRFNNEVGSDGLKCWGRNSYTVVEPHHGVWCGSGCRSRWMDPIFFFRMTEWTWSSQDVRSPGEPQLRWMDLQTSRTWVVLIRNNPMKLKLVVDRGKVAREEYVTWFFKSIPRLILSTAGCSICNDLRNLITHAVLYVLKVGCVCMTKVGFTIRMMVGLAQLIGCK